MKALEHTLERDSLRKWFNSAHSIGWLAIGFKQGRLEMVYMMHYGGKVVLKIILTNGQLHMYQGKRAYLGIYIYAIRGCGRWRRKLFEFEFSTRPCPGRLTLNYNLIKKVLQWSQSSSYKLLSKVR